MVEPAPIPGWVARDTLRIPRGDTDPDVRLWDGLIDVTPGHPQFEKWLEYAPPRPGAEGPTTAP